MLQARETIEEVVELYSTGTLWLKMTKNISFTKKASEVNFDYSKMIEELASLAIYKKVTLMVIFNHCDP